MTTATCDRCGEATTPGCRYMQPIKTRIEGNERGLVVTGHVVDASKRPLLRSLDLCDRCIAQLLETAAIDLSGARDRERNTDQHTTGADR